MRALVARRPVAVGIALEVVLFAVALVLGTSWGIRPLALHLGAAWWFAGGLLTLPPLVALAVTLRSRSAWAVRLVQVVDDVAEILLARASSLSLVLLAAAAGVAEETLFRGVLQAALSARVGETVAVLVAGVLFGAAHAISVEYAVVATAMGLYLGAAFATTGNLIIPIVIHAIYDCIALLAFHHRVRGRHRAFGPAAEGGREL